MSRARPRPMSTAAALIALLMLSFASLQSIIMQVAQGPPGAAMLICGKVDPSGATAVATAGMQLHLAVAASAPTHPQGGPHQHHNLCLYCSAAGHAPVLAHAALLRAASACEFPVYQSVASLGPRGPPAQQPRARGPPIRGV